MPSSTPAAGHRTPGYAPSALSSRRPAVPQSPGARAHCAGADRSFRAFRAPGWRRRAFPSPASCLPHAHSPRPPRAGSAWRRLCGPRRRLAVQRCLMSALLATERGALFPITCFCACRLAPTLLPPPLLRRLCSSQLRAMAEIVSLASPDAATVVVASCVPADVQSLAQTAAAVRALAPEGVEVVYLLDLPWEQRRDGSRGAAAEATRTLVRAVTAAGGASVLHATGTLLSAVDPPSVVATPDPAEALAAAVAAPRMRQVGHPAVMQCAHLPTHSPCIMCRAVLVAGARVAGHGPVACGRHRRRAGGDHVCGSLPRRRLLPRPLRLRRGRRWGPSPPRTAPEGAALGLHTLTLTHALSHCLLPLATQRT